MKWWLSVCDGADQYRAYTYTGTDDRTRYPCADENAWYKAPCLMDSHVRPDLVDD